MTKLTIVALISNIGTVIIVIGFPISAVYGISPAMYVIGLSGTTLDVLLDVISVTLSLKINVVLYLKVCGRCDSSMKRCCHGISNRLSRKQEMELAVTTVADGTADTTVDTSAVDTSAPPIPMV